MTVYRSRSPWWRTRSAWLILATCGYLLVIAALCGGAAALLQ